MAARKAPARKAPARKRKTTTTRTPANGFTSKAEERRFMTGLNTDAKAINARLDKASKAEGDAFDHRLAAALTMEVARKKCEKGGVAFRKWTEDNITQSYETIRKLVAVGGSSDPRKALEDMRAANAKANRKARKKAKTGSRDTTSETQQLTGPKPTAYKGAINSLDALPDNEQLAVATHAAEANGMRVVSLAEAKELHKLRTAAEKAPPVDEAVTIANMKKRFNSMAPAAKYQFATWAAKEIGLKVESKYSDDDLTEIPAELDRRPKRAKRRTRKAA